MDNQERQTKIQELKSVVAKNHYELIRLNLERDYLKENEDKLSVEQKARLSEIEATIQPIQEEYTTAFSAMRAIQIPYELTYSIDVNGGGLERATNKFFLSTESSVDTSKDEKLDFNDIDVQSLLKEISQIFYYNYGGAVLHNLKRV